MGKEEVGKATLRRDWCKLGLVGWIHLQLKSYRNWTFCLVFFLLLAVHLSQVYDLEAKADTQDEGSYGGDKARKEGVEGEGSHLWIVIYIFHSNTSFREEKGAHQAAVEELEHPSEEDVGEVSINNLQLPEIQIYRYGIQEVCPMYIVQQKH